MSISLTGLLRGIALLAAAACLLAIGMARLEPTPAHYWIMKANGLIGIDRQPSLKCGTKTVLLDPETGQIVRMGLPGNDEIQCAAASPWQDEQGQTQLVGRWVSRRGTSALCENFGLARYQFPGGQALEHIPMDVVPLSHPCFFPDNPSRILFTAADGSLYRFQFQEDRERSDPAVSERHDGEPRRPQAVTWKVRPPAQVVRIADPIWPTDRRLKGRLIASLSYLEPRSDGVGQVFSNLALWWLELSLDGREIVDAGRITGPHLTGPKLDERFPSMAIIDGEPVLGWLTARQATNSWSFRIAHLEFPADNGQPSIQMSESRLVPGPFLPSLPVFSSDGASVYVLPESKTQAIRRVSVPGLFTAGARSNDLALGTVGISRH